MPALTLTPDDLTPFADIDDGKAIAMIDDAMAMAALVAPCILGDDLTESKVAAARALIRGAILRWHDAGTGAFTQQSAGPYQVSVDNRNPRKGMFWPSEITQLQQLCSSGQSGIFSVDTVGLPATQHADTCALRFGATYCSCGADIAGFPLYGA